VYKDVNNYISKFNGFADAAAAIKMWEDFQAQLNTGRGYNNPERIAANLICVFLTNTYPLLCTSPPHLPLIR